MKHNKQGLYNFQIFKIIWELDIFLFHYRMY